MADRDIAFFESDLDDEEAELEPQRGDDGAARRRNHQPITATNPRGAGRPSKKKGLYGWWGRGESKSKNVWGDAEKIKIDSHEFGDIRGRLNDYVMRYSGGVKTELVQSLVNPFIEFRRNSVNMVIGHRGSGKTYHVMLEIFKLFMYGQAPGFEIALTKEQQKELELLNRENALEHAIGLNERMHLWTTREEMEAIVDDILNSREDKLRAEIQRGGVPETMNPMFVQDDILDPPSSSDRVRPMITTEYVPVQTKPKEPGFRYSQVIYVSDKVNDDTVDMFKGLLPEWVGFEFITPSQAVIRIIQLATEKKQYEEKPTEALAKRLHCDTFGNPAIVPHTVIIFDDCIGLFTQRGGKDGYELSRLCFQNRQMRATIFLVLQDPVGISPMMKANTDSLLFFGGFPKRSWDYLFNQLTSVPEGLYKKYSTFGVNEALYLDFITKFKNIASGGDNKWMFKVAYDKIDAIDLNN